MKLLTKYNRLTITVAILAMLITGIVYYFTISFVLNNQVDKALLVEEYEVQNYVRLNHHLPLVIKTNHQDITFKAVALPIQRRFVDTVYRDLKDKELEPARALYTNTNVKGQKYQVQVVQSKVETEDLLGLIFLITLGLVAILVAAFFFLNRVILSHLWQPFYKILKQLSKFQPSGSKDITPVTSSIDEFTELDRAVRNMETRVKTEYQTLKAFTENASHELMTPISVINSKLDTLLQTGELSDLQSMLLDDIYTSVSRLTRLNKSMLLLAKIENRLITDEQNVNVKALIANQLGSFEEWINGKTLKLETELHDCNIHVSLLLMEVLVGNLLGNAIRHNLPGGIIRIHLTDNVLKISNSSLAQNFEFDLLVKRFQKSSSSEGTGLGLAICKQICDSYGFNLSHSYHNELHNLVVSFQKQ